MEAKWSRSHQAQSASFVQTGEYELRSISRVPLYTTRSIWTFVTNQRRILDDNAPEHSSRSEAQLLVVKFAVVVAVLVKKGHHKVK